MAVRIAGPTITPSMPGQTTHQNRRGAHEPAISTMQTVTKAAPRRIMAQSLKARSATIRRPRLYNVHEPGRGASRAQACPLNRAPPDLARHLALAVADLDDAAADERRDLGP